jgi:glycerophosphoryl diester phosphodiesterase
MVIRWRPLVWSLGIGIMASLLITTPLLNLEAHAATYTYPTLVGHRGVGDPWTAQLGIPENSIPAIQWAAGHHADVVEGDVTVSGPEADGSRTMYMMHDSTLDRTTNGSGGSNTRPWSYISQRWLEVPIDKDGNGDPDNTTHHPPSFRDWLAAAKGTGKLVFIELKGSSYWPKEQVKKYVDEVIAQGMMDRVITAGSETKLAYFKSYSSGKRSWSANDYPEVAKVQSVAGSSGYATIELSIAEDRPEYVKQLQDAGVHVFVWTLDNEGHYARALPLEAYGWMCDNTQNAWEWLQANGA